MKRFATFPARGVACLLLAIGTGVAARDTADRPAVVHSTRTGSTGDIFVNCSYRPDGNIIDVDAKLGSTRSARWTVDIGAGARVVDVACDGAVVTGGHGLVAVLIAAETRDGKVSYRIAYGSAPSQAEGTQSMIVTKPLLERAADGTTHALSVRLFQGDSVMANVTLAKRDAKGADAVSGHVFLNHCLLGSPAATAEKLFQHVELQGTGTSKRAGAHGALGVGGIGVQ